MNEKKSNVKKPNAIIYFIAYIILMPLIKLLFRLEIDRRNFTPPKGACITICNHASFMDFLVVMLALYPRRYNAVAAQKFFLYKPLHWLLPLMGCIPKNLFDADVRSIIGVKKVLARGGAVLLFPEGRCECDGVYAGMNTATGKLIKKLEVPVVSCSIDGAYKCMPFWRKGKRFGRVRIVMSNLFTADSLKDLSVEQINEAVDRRMAREEDPPLRTPRKNRARRRPMTLHTFGQKRLAEGLQLILYWCPKCGQEFTTQTKGNVISCSACGNAAELDREMKLIPLSPDSVVPGSAGLPGADGLPTIHDWYREQARYEAKKLHEDMDPICIKVRVQMPAAIPGGGMHFCGDGVLSLDPKGWHFNGELSGDKVSLFFPINTVPALPIDPNDVFQIYANGTFYCFVTEDPWAVIKYSVIGECAYWRFATDIKMTPRKDSGFAYER